MTTDNSHEPRCKKIPTFLADARVGFLCTRVRPTDGRVPVNQGFRQSPVDPARLPFTTDSHNSSTPSNSLGAAHSKLPPYSGSQLSLFGSAVTAQGVGNLPPHVQRAGSPIRDTALWYLGLPQWSRTDLLLPSPKSSKVRIDLVHRAAISLHQWLSRS